MPVVVSAPSRIHFGLFSIGKLSGREFGGAGLMLREPRSVLQFEENAEFEIALPLALRDSDIAERITSHAETWQQVFAATNGSNHEPMLPKCRIELRNLPRQHSGLGTGTQLALAIHTGLSELAGIPRPAPFELISAANRGKRSAIGSYGFFEGGFLIDRGKSERDLVAPLDFRDRFPNWPIVLAISKAEKKVFGPAEIEAFKNLPPTQPTERERIIDRVRERMVPALVAEDFETFSTAVHELGASSGKMFEPVQGGVYGNSTIASIVSAMQKFGVAGVGQSSWGPCVFGFAKDHSNADQLIDFLSEQFADCEFIKTTADNEGAIVSRT